MSDAPDMRLVGAGEGAVREVVSRVIGGGGTGGGDGLESRVAKVEAAVKHIQSDITEIKADIREMRRTNFAMFLITWGGLFGLASIISLPKDLTGSSEHWAAA